MSGRQLNVWLVQRSVWAMESESMPLAMAYLQAYAQTDEQVRTRCNLRIFNFGGGDTLLTMARRLFYENEVPDVIAFSVLGWNYGAFGRLAETFRRLNPSGWVVFGGTHVTDCGGRVFAMFPAVDLVVNGEGELTFLDILRARLAGRAVSDLGDVPGLSFQTPAGKVVTTAARPRIEDLDIIPSPLLSGVLSLRDETGRPRYDVVLLETNRGCPYQCAFCYWGGAIGQRVRRFSPQRMAAEIDFIARERIADVVLCDANFGMLPEDEAFVDHFIACRERYGYPRSFETSWAKNKGRVFYSIVEKMVRAGMRSSFTLALQSLYEPAITLMRRKNMKLNAWQDLADWMQAHQLECYAELIWGTPGETYESFLRGYENLSRRVSRIAVYPLLIMPNTAYSEEREKHGFVLLRSEKDDFEYVLSHKTISYEDNARMHRFIFWARVVAENQIFRHIWQPLLLLTGITQLQVLLSLDSWFDSQTDAISQGLLACRAEMVNHLDASRVTSGITYFYRQPRLRPILQRWWREAILPRIDAPHQGFFTALFDWDLATMPIYRPSVRPGEADPDPEPETVTLHGERYYLQRGVETQFNIPEICNRIKRRETFDLTPVPRPVTLYFRTGFATHIDNHEFVARYCGKIEAQIDAEHSKQTGGVPLPVAMEFSGDHPS